MIPALKSLLPRSLYGRAALILIVPVVTIQLVVSLGFIQRHFEGVTRQMTVAVAQEIRLIRDQIDAAPNAAAAWAQAAALAGSLDYAVAPASGPLPAGDGRDWYDLSGRQVIATLRQVLPGLQMVELGGTPREVRIWFSSAEGMVQVTVPRRRVSASNPHQLLVLMIVTSVLMTLVAYYFLRAQLRPITRLAEAAAAFGKGQTIAYRPRGAIEVRAAGSAFLDMRARIERQIEQRTLMLSGVSHDLRTPLTRLRLGLSLLPEDAETRALMGDVAQMERMVDEFLAFVRGDTTEEPQDADPQALAAAVIANAQRAGHNVKLAEGEPGKLVRLRPQAITRALENLVGNAVRHGTLAEIAVLRSDRTLRFVVEDDGPGIRADRREEALRPFTRLEAERDPNRGGGVGLGLTIAADVARSHGGQLRLLTSERLGGLRAELQIAR